MNDSIATGTMNYCVCLNCDALCRDLLPGPSERVRCPRCGTVLRTGRVRAVDLLLAISCSVIVLMVVAIVLPFLVLVGGGQTIETNVLHAVKAVGKNELWFLEIIVGLVIVILPILRSSLLIYVLLPVRLGRRCLPMARLALRLVIDLRPWAMAEVFVVGVAVALVKITGYATIVLEPGFWLFCAVAVLVVCEDACFCRRTIWDLLE